MFLTLSSSLSLYKLPKAEEQGNSTLLLSKYKIGFHLWAFFVKFGGFLSKSSGHTGAGPIPDIKLAIVGGVQLPAVAHVEGPDLSIQGFAAKPVVLNRIESNYQ